MKKDSNNDKGVNGVSGNGGGKGCSLEWENSDTSLSREAVFRENWKSIITVVAVMVVVAAAVVVATQEWRRGRREWESV